MLLICLAGLFVVQPMLPRSPGGAAAIISTWRCRWCCWLESGASAAGTSLLLACVSLISVGLGAAWLARTDGNPTLALVALSCFLGFLIFTVGSVLVTFSRRRK